MHWTPPNGQTNDFPQASTSFTGYPFPRVFTAGSDAMKWTASRLLRSRNKSSVSGSLPFPATTSLPGPYLSQDEEANNRSDWHAIVTECVELQHYFRNGTTPELRDIVHSVPLAITDKYLASITDRKLDEAQIDQRLGTLIEEHASIHPCGREVAIVSCMRALSIAAARRQILALQEGSSNTYLKLLKLASAMSPSIASPLETSLILPLQCVLGPPKSHFDSMRLLRSLLEIVGQVEEWNVLSPAIILKTLDVGMFGECLQTALNEHLYNHRYLTAFKSVAWMKTVLELPNATVVRQLLDYLLPCWGSLQSWEPNIQRVSQFELKGFRDEHVKKLGTLLSLEGPDHVTQKHTCLARAELPRGINAQQAESMLDLLYRCQALGPSTVDLYARLCNDWTLEQVKETFLEEVVSQGDDVSSQGLLQLMITFDDNGNITQKLKVITRTIPSIKALASPFLSSAFTATLFEPMEPLLRRAQETFLQSLRVGSGKKIGMVIYEFGSSLRGAEFIHEYISNELLSHVQRYPSRDIVETLFDRIWETSRDRAIENCRLKSYLASALGGQSLRLDETITLECLENEISFWNEPMGTARRDLARIVERSQCVTYSLYTSWLMVLLREDDQFVLKVKHLLASGEQGLLRFGEYLSLRRKYGTMQDETWLRLFAGLIQDRGPEYLRRHANTIPVPEWLELVTHLLTLVDSIRGHLPQYGSGLTQEQVEWWTSLAQRKTAMSRIFHPGDHNIDPRWLYFPKSIDRVTSLLELVEGSHFNSTPSAYTLSYLSSDGSNLALMCECLKALLNVSSLGSLVIQRQILRHKPSGVSKLSEAAIGHAIRQWSTASIITTEDKKALSHISKLMEIPRSSGRSSQSELCQHLEDEYETLITRARALENSRLKMSLSDRTRAANFAKRIGIESEFHRRFAQDDIGEDIADAVECLSEGEYEISFPLTSLNEIERVARGLPLDARLLLVKLNMSNGVPRNIQTSFFPVHASPTFLAFNVQTALADLSRQGPSIPTIHTTVTNLTSSAPDYCFVCRRDLGLRLWKPATCSKNCSVALRRVPLEIRLHHLLVDPKAIDLLLTAICATVAEGPSADFLPGCPVQFSDLLGVINSLPDLSTLQTASDLRQAIVGNDKLGIDRERLLSWLCLRFRGFILSAPSHFKVPSLGLNTHHFVMVDSCLDRELAFRAHLNLSPATSPASTIVFHGTHASRLFPILCNGLAIGGNGVPRINGAAYGSGVYCGHEMSPSWGFSGSTSQSWSHSQLGNLRVMLGCELAPATPPTHGGVHVITDETRLLVRYVFLLPDGFQPPVRTHVEPSMMAGIARLRAGLSR